MNTIGVRSRRTPIFICILFPVENALSTHSDYRKRASEKVLTLIKRRPFTYAPMFRMMGILVGTTSVAMGWEAQSRPNRFRGLKDQ
jgi:hypothetical protein